MSIDLDWSGLENDNTLNDTFRDFLNDQFQNLELPDYLSDLQVVKFSLGTIPPNLTIRHIGDPFPEFYPSADDTNEAAVDFSEVGTADNSETHKVNKRIEMPRRVDRSSNVSSLDQEDKESSKETDREEDHKSNKDIQFVVEVEYKGDITIEIQVDLLLNYPSPGFIKLPVNLKIVQLGIHSLAVLSYVQKCCYISFLCDVNDEQFDDIIRNPTLSRDSNRTRIDIIRSMKIESEIGDNQGDGSILRNVGKVERFLTEMLREMLRDELAWPGWICLDFNDDEDEDGDD